MIHTVQARLDDETAALLAELRRRHGWSASDVVRRGIQALTSESDAGKRRLPGVGAHASGIDDLATNPAHLEGFGS
ncbi:MAG: ribbon-helix-helix protein, CopG family [Lacipirellulaceae bacterium]